MASSVLHYIISRKIAENIHVQDIDSFLMGAVIAPDTGTREDDSYNMRHFFERDYAIGQKGINWMTFAEQNSGRMSEDYYLGYFCHLIEDAIWYHDYFDRYIRIYSQEVRAEKFPGVYRDYWRLNYLLRKDLGVTYVPLKTVSVPDDTIDAAVVASKVEGVNKQFEAPECSKEELEMIPWDFIWGYIDTCVTLCLSEIAALRGTGHHLDPKEYFASVREPVA